MIPNETKTYQHGALLVFDGGRFDLAPEFGSSSARDLYLVVGAPRSMRYAIPLRRSGVGLEWLRADAEWVAARSVFEVPRPEVAGAKPRRAIISSRVTRARRVA